MGSHNKKERRAYVKRMKGERKLARNLNNKILETVIACEVEAK